jgi:hypothetical protein
MAKERMKPLVAVARPISLFREGAGVCLALPLIPSYLTSASVANTRQLCQMSNVVFNQI